MYVRNEGKTNDGFQMTSNYIFAVRMMLAVNASSFEIFRMVDWLFILQRVSGIFTRWVRFLSTWKKTQGISARSKSVYQTTADLINFCESVSKKRQFGSSLASSRPSYQIKCINHIKENFQSPTDDKHHFPTASNMIFRTR